jgi:Protein of unknown function (DUF3164)
MSNNTSTPDVPKGYWLAADGSLIPESKVSDVDKARDKLVKGLIADAKKLSGGMAEFKALSLAHLAEFIQRSADEYNVVLRGAAGKGNVTLTTYDGRFKVMRAMQETIAFDERLQVAKAKVDECILRWAKGANRNLQVLVNRAFETDKQGNVSAGRILALRSYEIDDPDWKLAMEAIADSMRVVASKAYVRFYERDEASGEYKAINLDIAGL